MAIVNIASGKDYSDADYITAFINADRIIQNALYKKWVAYFNEHCGDYFAMVDSQKADIIHDCMIVVHDKVRSGAIRVVGGKVTNMNGKPFTSTLMTYMMSVAIIKKKEYLRKQVNMVHWDGVYNTFEEWIEVKHGGSNVIQTSLDEPDKRVIVSRCILQLPKRCQDILTMFYYRKMSLDEIMHNLSDEGIHSKDALKTRKNKCMNTLKTNARKEYSLSFNS